jgi:ribosomal protein RSM22 (predicted rRNA methylase)
MDDPLQLLVRLIYEYLYGEALPCDPFKKPPSLGVAEIAQGVAELSRLYTRERRRISSALLNNSSLRKAYLGYFLPLNAGKVRRIFREIQAHPEAASLFSGRRRLLDLGCGPGTSVLGFLSLWDEGMALNDSLQCVAADSVRANLQDVEHLFRRYTEGLKHPRGAAHLSTRHVELPKVLSLSVEGPFDFIVFGNVLNELFADSQDSIDKRCELVATVAKKWLAADGFLILIEPALRETSRELLRLRDRLLDQTDLRVYSPCVHNLHCPAVSPENLSDWCHEDRSWCAPGWIQAIDALVGNRKDSLKYSYVVFGRSGLSVAEAAFSQDRGRRNDLRAEFEPGSQVWRVVSERMEEKGKSFVYICGSAGRAKVTLLDKHASKDNQSFRKLARGQVVLTKDLKVKSPSDWRVEVKTVVKDLM